MITPYIRNICFYNFNQISDWIVISALDLLLSRMFMLKYSIFTRKYAALLIDLIYKEVVLQHCCE